MTLSFYKSKYGNISDKLIAWWTRPNFFKFWQLAQYSHVEMTFSNGESFSSSSYDGGTRWKIIEFKDKWDFIHIPNINEETIKSLCYREENKRYDWVCLFLSGMFPLRIHIQNKWVCSELCASLVFRLKDAHTYSPQKLYEHIKDI